MATQTEDRMLSEKIAPVLVARTLGPFDLVVIFVAIVLFINNSAGVQLAGRRCTSSGSSRSRRS